MVETLQALLGPEARGFSASCVSRPAEQWNGEMERWREADLSDRRWACIRADGICCGLRAEDVKLCALVAVGVDECGIKRLLAVEDGARESADSWLEALTDLKGRGMSAPKLAVGDGALGFWAALDQAYPHTRHRRCRLRKTGDILNVPPESVQPRAKQALQQIWMA